MRDFGNTNSFGATRGGDKVSNETSARFAPARRIPPMGENGWIIPGLRGGRCLSPFTGTIRDALQSLSSRKLVETRPGQGTFVIEKFQPFITTLSGNWQEEIGYRDLIRVRSPDQNEVAFFRLPVSLA